MARKTLVTWGLAAAVACCLPGGIAMAGVPAIDQPRWVALMPEQKVILAPLEKEWDKMESYRRKKWLGIAQRYPDMSPAEQASMQRNMREWARLAPEERKAAREKFKTLKKASPEDQQVVRQKWEEYNALPQEERNRLRAEANLRPPAKMPAQPAAQTTQPPGRMSGEATPRSPLSPLKAPQSTLLPAGSKPPTP